MYYPELDTASSIGPPRHPWSNQGNFFVPIEATGHSFEYDNFDLDLKCFPEIMFKHSKGNLYSYG